ncbi:ParA family protein (plasmid) [Alteromonas macleodii]|uniref:ParA family protein n=1 Tax=Alteromonas macleodii TaxID=28108 RepID=UPI0030CEC1A2
MIIHIGFNKGGTRKTTVALMLALYFVECGKRVAICDLDGQEDMSRLLGKPKDYKGKGSEKLFDSVVEGDFPLLPVEEWKCRADVEGQLFYIPASHGKLADINRIGKESFVHNFKENTKRLAEQFDVVIIDTPPSLVLTQMASLAAANSVVMPLNADFNGCGIEKVKQYFTLYNSVKKKYNKSLGLPSVILSAVDIKGKQAKDYVAWARDFFGNRITSRYIEQSAAVQNAVIDKRAVWYKCSSGNDRSKGATYRRVLDELVAITGK